MHFSLYEYPFYSILAWNFSITLSWKDSTVSKQIFSGFWLCRNQFCIVARKSTPMRGEKNSWQLALISAAQLLFRNFEKKVPSSSYLEYNLIRF
jgi:hypothetical protein